MPDEISPPAAENPEVPPVETPAPVQAAPPPAAAVVNGARNEGEPAMAAPAPETELEQLRDERAENLTPAARRKLETRIAELEKQVQDLKAIPAPKPKKEKRHNWFSPVIGAEGENE